MPKDRGSFKGRDIAALYKKAQKRSEHIEELRAKDSEKAERLLTNIAYERAFRRAQGEKVKVCSSIFTVF